MKIDFFVLVKIVCSCTDIHKLCNFYRLKLLKVAIVKYTNLHNCRDLHSRLKQVMCNGVEVNGSIIGMR